MVDEATKQDIAQAILSEGEPLTLDEITSQLGELPNDIESIKNVLERDSRFAVREFWDGHVTVFWVHSAEDWKGSFHLFESYVALVSKVAMFCGILGIGVALGAAFGLSILQEACIGAGQLPAPGITVLPGTLEDNACLDGARQLQSIANGSGVVGAGAVLVGGVLDRFDDRLLEVVG